MVTLRSPQRSLEAILAQLQARPALRRVCVAVATVALLVPGLYASAQLRSGNGATLTVRVKGTTGQEQFAVIEAGTRLATFTAATTWKDYTVTTPSPAGAPDVEVAFLNDGAEPADRNLLVDSVAYGGRTYAATGPDVTGTGVWENGGQCQPGQWRSRELACNGSLAFGTLPGPAPAPKGGEPSTLELEAGGSTGNELVEVRVDGAPVTVLRVPASRDLYSGSGLSQLRYRYPGPLQPGQVTVAFINDRFEPGVDYNVRLRSARLDGQPLDVTEVALTGAGAAAALCHPQALATEIIACNGYFRFAAGDGAPEDDTTTVAASPSTLTTDAEATTTTVADTTTSPDTTSPDSTTRPPTTARPRTTTTRTRPTLSGAARANLELIHGQTVRNRNEDASADRNTPSDQLNLQAHFGPRSEYLGNPAGNPEQDFPVEEGGQFRIACEFSHFSYDDPIVFPGQPGASHLHIYFGNTDTNAYTTADSLLNSGASTCNGGELNRSAYWAPALIDDKGNARIPERIVVYYKGEGLANGKAEVAPAGAAMVSKANINAIDNGRGGAIGKYSFTCSDNYSGPSSPASNTLLACDGGAYQKAYGVSDPHVVLEMNIKFPQCWNGQDPTNPANYSIPTEGSWYYSYCTGEFDHTLVNLEYFIDYPVGPDESTAGWYLSSDVDAATRTLNGRTPGATVHADWWNGWNKQVNRLWINNCVNHRVSQPSGCGFGYLTDGGPDGNNPLPGPALKYRKQWTGGDKVPVSQLHAELCPGGGPIASAAAGAYCRPGNMVRTMSASTAGPAGDGAGGRSVVFCPLGDAAAASPASAAAGVRRATRVSGL